MESEELIIVRGDIKNKPVSSERLATIFEPLKSDLSGVLYLGYPIIGTSDGGYQIDAILITKQTGIVIFNLVEGEERLDYEVIQNENYSKLTSKLIQESDLVSGRRLGFEMNTVTYAPIWVENSYNDTYACFSDEAQLVEYIKSLEWEKPEYYASALSVLQSITTIRKTKSRAYVKKTDSKGAKLKKIEDSIANLDKDQNQAVVETVDGVQRIRGLAGSGKTIILALKVAYLHTIHPDWKIAVTFNTRSLKAQLKNYIQAFCIKYSNEEPDWDQIEVINAWGSSGKNSRGIYYDVCMDHNIEFLDVRGAQRLTADFNKKFDKVCEKALSEIENFKEKYDLIVIDEAQDFGKEFLQICYKILKSPKRLVYAYDELQSLNQKSMDSPEILFGNGSNGKPLVTLTSNQQSGRQDITLEKCYRNPREILTSAHALGFGIYRNELVQMFDNSKLWEDVGYKVVNGELIDGSEVTLSRDASTSPEFLSNHSSIDEMISFHSFEDNLQQVEFVVDQIIKNVEEEELKLDDIIVINANPLTTKSLVGAFRSRLFDKGINSNLAGVSSSPDVFFEDNTITFTGIYRAKGNEAAMVYIINSQYCNSGYALSKRRNILFTAMTRSKAWVRVCGYGEEMSQLKSEFNTVVNNDFQLKFKYPTIEERKHINMVNRDMTNHEMNAIDGSKKSLEFITKNIRDGKLKKEDLAVDDIEELRKFLDEN